LILPQNKTNSLYITKNKEFHMDNSTTINQVAFYKSFFANMSDEDFQSVSKEEIVQMFEKLEAEFKKERE